MRSFFTLGEEGTRGGEGQRERERPKDQFVTGREREEKERERGGRGSRPEGPPAIGNNR